MEPGHYFFHEGDELKHFYLVVEGTIAISIAVPDPEVEQTFVMQLTRNTIDKELTVSTIGAGEMFGWSGLVPYWPWQQYHR